MSDLTELKRDLAEGEEKIAAILAELENKYGAEVEIATNSVVQVAGHRFVSVELSMRVGSGG